jgi:hypothetical protein
VFHLAHHDSESVWPRPELRSKPSRQCRHWAACPCVENDHDVGRFLSRWLAKQNNLLRPRTTTMPRVSTVRVQHSAISVHCST